MINTPFQELTGACVWKFKPKCKNDVPKLVKIIFRLKVLWLKHTPKQKFIFTHFKMFSSLHQNISNVWEDVNFLHNNHLYVPEQCRNWNTQWRWCIILSCASKCNVLKSCGLFKDTTIDLFQELGFKLSKFFYVCRLRKWLRIHFEVNSCFGHHVLKRSPFFMTMCFWKLLNCNTHWMYLLESVLNSKKGAFFSSVNSIF